MSPSDLSHELRVPLSNVNYHVVELLKSGMIELASQRQVRGATEHFYRHANSPNGLPPSAPLSRSNGTGPVEELQGAERVEGAR
jgi:predicted ArsR family transcriptional regulator